MQHNTTKLIDDLQQQTDDFIQKAVSEWQMVTPAVLLQQPGDNNWSLAQCLEHLNSYGRYYLPAIEAAIARAKKNNWASKATFPPGWLGEFFTNLMSPETGDKK